MSCQPHRVTPGQSTWVIFISKFMHVSKLLSYKKNIKHLSSLQNQSLCKHKTYIHKHHTQNFEELVTSILPLLKEHISLRLGHAGIIDHSV